MGAFTWAIVNDRPLCAVAAAMSELGHLQTSRSVRR